MGALTAKTHQFNFRPWEKSNFIKIDATEATSYRLRVEKLKTKTVRLLPIKFWASDNKRYETNINKNLKYSKNVNLINYIIDNLKEKNELEILINPSKIYKDMGKQIKYKNYKIMTGKKVDEKTHKTIKILNKEMDIYSDFLTNSNIKKYFKLQNDGYYSSFEEELKDVSTITFLMNPRLISPMLNAYLFENNEKFDFISFSSFSSNLQKEELPLSEWSIQKFIKKEDGKKSICLTSIFSSFDASGHNFFTNNTIEVSPLYLKGNYSFKKFVPSKNQNIINFGEKNYINMINTDILYSTGKLSKISGPQLYEKFEKFYQKDYSLKLLLKIFLFKYTTGSQMNNHKFGLQTFI